MQSDKLRVTGFQLHQPAAGMFFAVASAGGHR
jgi:hypothetical protein